MFVVWSLRRVSPFQLCGISEPEILASAMGNQVEPACFCDARDGIILFINGVAILKVILFEKNNIFVLAEENIVLSLERK